MGPAELADRYSIAMNQAMIQARENQRNQELALRRQYFGNLLNMLGPLHTGGTFKRKTTGWNVQGDVGYSPAGLSGLSGGGGGAGGGGGGAMAPWGGGPFTLGG
jgi:hypothetical protein